MGAPSSSIVSEIFLQHVEHTHLPRLTKIHRLINYFRYVDNILLVYDSSHTDIITILNDFNSIHSNLSHTSAHVLCFRPGNGFSSTSHRDLSPLRVSSVQFVLSFGRGGERAESEFSYVVALVFVRTLSPTSSRGTAPRVEPARLRRSTSKGGARKSRDTGDKRGPKQGAPVATTQVVRSNERRNCWLSALRGPRYPGMSRVIETDEETFIVVGGN